MNRAHVGFGLLEKTQSGDFAVAKMIIFDYGRTLYDRETDDFFPDAIPVVKTLAEQYRLSIVSVSPADEEEARIEALREQGILDHFEEIVFTASGDAKSKEYEALLRKVGLIAFCIFKGILLYSFI